uniref:Xaa-Pro aminopeptidase n=1 Tax=Timema monikensis TaxID=170555 RepID=A0A7R9HSM1_9NEOP|nr:unnamed protein product [Timema monikensis]
MKERSGCSLRSNPPPSLPLDVLGNALPPRLLDHFTYVQVVASKKLDLSVWTFFPPYSPCLIHSLIARGQAHIWLEFASIVTHYNTGFAEVSDEKRVPHPSPILFMKARKNPRERAGMRNAHVRDGAALCDFIAHMEDEVLDTMSRGEVWTEVEVAKTVDQFRREQLDSRGLSFATIAGFGPNGALPHYTPAVTTNRQIYTNSTLVLDSGGQYLDGTTDVTRTLHFGSPNQFERETYTRVLQGSIQLSALVFPQGVLMSDVDVLARAPLWQVGLDYRHGTGHGIGAFLDVHESPVNIIYKGGNKMFEEGYFFSDEPGYYHEGFFGVRLENILEVVNRTTTHSFDGPYLGFEPVTLVPYEPKLIDLNMLSNEQHRTLLAAQVTPYHHITHKVCLLSLLLPLRVERSSVTPYETGLLDIQWLNDYNAKVIEKVGAELKLQRRMKGFHWLLSKTIYIPAHGATSGVEEENQQRPSIVICPTVRRQLLPLPVGPPSGKMTGGTPLSQMTGGTPASQKRQASACSAGYAIQAFKNVNPSPFDLIASNTYQLLYCFGAVN